ncbi:MAG: hypothetical protein RI964_558 [Pseudomonadota bacterium]|jgi:hypothetical protein
MSKQSNLMIMGSVGAYLGLIGDACAHPGIMPHPETTSEMLHLLEHALMVLPVVAGAWLLVWGAKRLTAKRTPVLIPIRKRG